MRTDTDLSREYELSTEGEEIRVQPNTPRPWDTQNEY